MLFSHFVKESIEKKFFFFFTKVKAVQILDVESLWSLKLHTIFSHWKQVFVGFFLHYSSDLLMLDWSGGEKQELI